MRHGPAVTSYAILALLIVSGVVVLTTEASGVPWPSSMSGLGVGIVSIVGFGSMGLLGGLVYGLLRLLRR